MCFDFLNTDRAKWEGTVGKSKIDGADMEADSSGALLPQVSFKCWDLPAPLVLNKESFTSEVLSGEVKVSDTVDLAGNRSFL